MKLVLYSGGNINENTELDRQVLRLVGKKHPSFTFIPSSCFEDSHLYFEDFVSSFSRFGVTDFFAFPIDVPFSSSAFKKALNRDFIFLSGGNTFYFLKHLKLSGMAQGLQSFIKKGGVLAGMSAGSILLTPNIATASIPQFDRDENEVAMKNWKAMGLARFEFFPHYINTKRYIEALSDHSWQSKWPLYACPDGSGIVIEDDRAQFIGRVWTYFKGEKFRFF